MSGRATVGDTRFAEDGWHYGVRMMDGGIYHVWNGPTQRLHAEVMVSESKDPLRLVRHRDGQEWEEVPAWFDIEPKDSLAIDLTKNLDMVAPHNENGERCPWPWDPEQLVGAALGQYRCPYCGAMVVAGMKHLDYGPVDEHGRSWLDRTHEEEMQAREDDEDWFKGLPS